MGHVVVENLGTEGPHTIFPVIQLLGFTTICLHTWTMYFICVSLLMLVVLYAVEWTTEPWLVFCLTDFAHRPCQIIPSEYRSRDFFRILVQPAILAFSLHCFVPLYLFGGCDVY